MASASCVLFAALCCALFAVCLSTPISRILGGDEATTDAFPYIVSVRRDAAHVCGGSIIAENFVLTAAHCVSELGNSPVESSRVTLRVGSTNQYAGGKLVAAAAIFIHNSYGSFLYDLALIKSVSNFELGPRVEVIPLAEPADAVEPGSAVTVAGWGRTESGGSYAYKLQYGNASVISAEDCNESIGYGYSSTLCLQNEPGQGTCNGDAGGPAVFNNKLYGVSNFVMGSCGTKYPDVFASVPYFKSWIDSTIEDA